VKVLEEDGEPLVINENLSLMEERGSVICKPCKIKWVNWVLSRLAREKEDLKLSILQVGALSISLKT
jgi:hypothetical protein